jgi:hypothetical protein
LNLIGLIGNCAQILRTNLFLAAQNGLIVK